MTDDLGRARFIGFIADRFQERHAPLLRRDEAESMAEGCLDAFLDMGKVNFGDPDFGWDEDGAHAVADEEIRSCWETVE